MFTEILFYEIICTFEKSVKIHTFFKFEKESAFYSFLKFE